MEELLGTTRLEEGKAARNEEIEVAGHTSGRERDTQCRGMVNTAATDPCPTVELTAASFRGVNLVRVPKAATKGDESVVGSDDHALNAGLCKLGDDSGQSRLCVRKTSPSGAQEAGLS